MGCLGLPKVQSWLDQFDYLDRGFAEQLLCKMRYVTFEDFEKNLSHQVTKVLEEIEAGDGSIGRVAIFPVRKPLGKSGIDGKEEKADNDSSGRVAHMLRNLERANERRFELAPRVESMRAKRIRHVIFVDDFLGTGIRFTEFWQSNVSSSVKSWGSLGWVKLWLVSYAAHGSGKSRVSSYVNQLHENSIRCYLPINKSFIGQRKEYRGLVEKYGALLYKNGASLGYGDIMSPVVFQHGCPNNVPGIFWGNGVKLKRREMRLGASCWKPLFPNRSISEDLYPLFTEDLSGEAIPEDLWSIGHYQLAIEFLNKFNSFGDGQTTLAVLAYLDKNVDVEKIQNMQVLTDEEISHQLNDLLKYGLIDHNRAVTRFGKEVLARTKKRARTEFEVPGENYKFYPQSFLGFHRES